MSTECNSVEAPGNARTLFALWALLGLGLLALALVFNGFLIDLAFRPWGGLLERVAERVPASRLRLAMGGAALLAGGLLLRQGGFFRWAARSSLRVNLVLLVTMLLSMVFTLEQVLSIRFYRDNSRSTTIFARDPDLGWRLRPGARGSWGEMPATINSAGLRGPELPEPSAVAQFRILFLGDSVTFGYRVRDDQPFPLITGRNLNAHNPARMVVPLNAGVGGYSPWQEYEYLVRHGLDLDPDLVLVCFVLNDVTEKFSLVQFGGSELGFQVRHTVEGLGDRLAGWSSIFAFGSYIRDRIRFGGEPAAAAREIERLQVMDLLYDQKKKELVDQAWTLTLENLDRIFLRCREEQVPAMLVILPYAFQLENPAAYGRPQAVLQAHTAEQGIDTVDLLPLLRRDLEERHLGIPAYFLDDNHLTTEGHRAVARILAGEIHTRGLNNGPAPPAP